MLESHKLVDIAIHCLSVLQSEVARRAGLGLTDESILCEDFVCGLLNLVYGYRLRNLNADKQNYPGIDLGDKENKVAYQVTSRCNPSKIISTLETFIEHKCHLEFLRLKFFVLVMRSTPRRRQYNTHGLVQFDPATDIEDFNAIIGAMRHMDVSRQEQIVNFIERSMPDAFPPRRSMARTMVPAGKGMRVCLAMGRIREGEDEMDCLAYVRSLAGLLAHTDYRYIYSATDAGNLATVFCREMIQISPESARRVFSFVAEEFDNATIPPSLSKEERVSWLTVFGNEIRYAGKTREIRRQRMVESSDVCVLMAGGRATAHYLELCMLLSVPVIPICFSGGPAQELFREPVRIEQCSMLIESASSRDGVRLLKAINSAGLDGQKRAMLTSELLRVLSAV